MAAVNATLLLFYLWPPVPVLVAAPALHPTGILLGHRMNFFIERAIEANRIR